MRTIEYAYAFKKDYKRVKVTPRHTQDVEGLLNDVLRQLLEDSPLPTVYRDHALKGKAKSRDKGWAEGGIEGRSECEAQGLAKGKADDLKRLLRRRFENMPAWAIQRIDAASIAQLDAWLDGLFEANSLEALIDTERH